MSIESPTAHVGWHYMHFGGSGVTFPSCHKSASKAVQGFLRGRLKRLKEGDGLRLAYAGLKYGALRFMRSLTFIMGCQVTVI